MIDEKMAGVLSMKYTGNTSIPDDERMALVNLMQEYYLDYKKSVAKLDFIQGEWWDQNDVEGKYGSRFFSYAHAKLRKAESSVKDIHKKMFYLLTQTDGFNIPFQEGFSSDAEQCYYEFMGKYNHD